MCQIICNSLICRHLNSLYIDGDAQNQLKAVNADELLYAQKNGAIIIDIRREEDKRKLL